METIITRSLLEHDGKSDDEIIQDISKELNKGGDVNHSVKPYLSETSYSLIEAAVMSLKPKVVNFILRRRPNINSGERNLVRSLCNNIELRNEDEACNILGDLAIAGVDFADDIDAIVESLSICAARGLALLMKELLNYVTPKNNETLSGPLLEAIESNSLEICRMLLDAGADVNGPAVGEIKNSGHRIPLFRACQKRRLQIIAMLLERGAHLKFNGNHAIKFAASSGSIECVDMIIDASADAASDDYWVSDLAAALRVCIARKRHACFERILVELVRVEDNPNPENNVDCLFNQFIPDYEHDGFHFIRIIIENAIECLSCGGCYLSTLDKWVRADATEIVELVLAEHPVDLFMEGKQELQLLLERCAVSERMKEILRTRIENSDEDGKLMKIRSVKQEEVKVEVKEEAEELVAGTRRGRNGEEVDDEKKKPKNSAAAKKKTTKK